MRQLQSNLSDICALLQHPLSSVENDGAQQLQEALQQGPEVTEGLIQKLSPSELCVLSDTLSQIASGAKETLDEDLQQALFAFKDQFQATLQRAIASGRSDLELIHYGSAGALRGAVMRGIRAREYVVHAGKALSKLLSDCSIFRTLSPPCQEALRVMAEAGIPLGQAFVEELASSQALTQCATRTSAAELAQLRAAISKAASSGVAVELVGLWATIHTALSHALTEDVSKLQAKTSALTSAVMATSKESAQSMGRLLTEAFRSSMVLASAVSMELQDAAKEMIEHGQPLAVLLAAELESNAHLIVESLPKEKALELKKLCEQAVKEQWGDFKDLTHQLGILVTKIENSPVFNTLETGTVDIYNAPLTQELLKDGLADLDSAFQRSRESIDQAIRAIAQGLTVASCSSFLAKFPPLLRFEIARDFSQTVNLFFTNLYGTILDQQHSRALRSLQNFFRFMYNLFAADFAELWAAHRDTLIELGFIVLFALIIAVYIAYLWFCYSAKHIHKRSDEIRQGHEGTTWAELATKQNKRIKITTYVLTACLSIYLPLTRVSIEILVGAITKDSSSDSSSSSSDGAATSNIIQERFRHHSIWPVLVFFAVLLLLTFTLPLPIILARLVTDNQPSGSPENPLVTYDLDGECVPFDDKIYSRLVNNDPNQLRCPYRSLYAGFEKKWSRYKVFQLLFKVALILPLIAVPHRRLSLRGVFCCIVYLTIVALTSYGTPFSDPLNNIMEISGKTTALVTCLGGTLIAFTSSSKLITAIGLVVNIANLVNFVVMIGIYLFGMKAIRIVIKNQLGTLTFSDTVRDIQDGPASQIIPKWDLEKEAKHRLWQSFWKALLLSFKDEQVVQRLLDLENAVRDSGIENIKSHWQGQATPYISQMRFTARLMLEGVDVYWNDPTGTVDGHLDSQTGFGKMYVRPYPFHCVMVYDDAKDEAIIRDHSFETFFMLNFSPKILRKRLLRQKLRALSDTGATIHLPFERIESVTVEDGTITHTHTDSQGNSHTTTETRYTTVNFTCHYNNGTISVTANTSKYNMADGFNVLMTYGDGYGDAVAPHTGKTHHLTNRVAQMGPEHIHLSHDMDETPRLADIFNQTQPFWSRHLPVLNDRLRLYRENLVEKHRNANRVLGDGFWFFVYSNPHITRPELERYLLEEEANPMLQGLVKSHAAALSGLFERVRFVFSHPAVTLWYVFWDDVFERNGDMKRLKQFRQELNPLNAGSICYRVMRRDELERWLLERKLSRCPPSMLSSLLRGRLLQLGSKRRQWLRQQKLHRSPCSFVPHRKNLFHDRLLRLLYDQMQTYENSKTTVM